MKQSWLYGCLSLMMMGLAMLHLKHLTPWVDEVMFLDTPMHYVKGMGWTTFAWYSAARHIVSLPINFFGLFLCHFPLFSYLCPVLFVVHTFYLLFRRLN